MVDPMYREIAEDLRRRSRTASSGGQAASDRARTHERYGASRNTIRDAIK